MDFSKVLGKKHSEYVSLTERSIDDLDAILTFYEAFIPDFFSKDGEADEIKNIYKKIKENGKDLYVQTIDLNKGSMIYQDYLDGMYQFIDDIFSISSKKNVENNDEYEEKFERAKSNDSLFIKSLFGGSLNKSIEIPVEEAVSSVEYLIDFMGQIKEMRDRCKDSFNKYNAQGLVNSTDNNLLSSSIQMLLTSVEDYCYTTLITILSSYECIKKVLSNDMSKKEVPKFQLF